MKRFKQYIKEATIPKLIYHGRTVKDPKFDYKHIGGKEAKDQEGPGFYFTTSKDEAFGYAHPKGVVISAEHKFTKLIDHKTKPNKKHALKLIESAPDLDDTLTNWGYDPPYMSRQEAFNELFDSVYDEDSAKETYLSIWGECYLRSGNSSLFVKNMAKLGYDGLLVESYKPKYHIVVYNIKKIKVINVENYEDLK
jgi:hypothetical protein